MFAFEKIILKTVFSLKRYNRYAEKLLLRFEHCNIYFQLSSKKEGRRKLFRVKLLTYLEILGLEIIDQIVVVLEYYFCNYFKL